MSVQSTKCGFQPHPRLASLTFDSFTEPPGLVYLSLHSDIRPLALVRLSLFPGPLACLGFNFYQDSAPLIRL